MGEFANKRKQKAALRRIAEDALAYCDGVGPCAGWFHETVDGVQRWCLTDGRRFVRLFEDTDIGVDKADGIQLQKYIGDVMGEYVLPDTEEIRAWTKNKETSDRGMFFEYRTPDGKSGETVVNAQYVLDMIDIFGSPKIEAVDVGCKGYYGLYFSDSLGDGLVLPIRR